MSRVNQFARNFEGECLSFSTELDKVNHISVVKGQQALKFKCKQGHSFYKYVDELIYNYKHHAHLFGASRKSSISTLASSSDEEEDMSRVWCPKCVEIGRAHV